MGIFGRNRHPSNYGTLTKGDPQDPVLYVGLVRAIKGPHDYDLGHGNYCGLVLMTHSMILVVKQGAFRIKYSSVTGMQYPPYDAAIGIFSTDNPRHVTVVAQPVEHPELIRVHGFDDIARIFQVDFDPVGLFAVLEARLFEESPYYIIRRRFRDALVINGDLPVRSWTRCACGAEESLIELEEHVVRCSECGVVISDYGYGPKGFLGRLPDPETVLPNSRAIYESLEKSQRACPWRMNDDQPNLPEYIATRQLRLTWEEWASTLPENNAHHV